MVVSWLMFFPPKSKIEEENNGFQKGFPFPKDLFFRLHVKFRGCMYVTCTLIWCCQGVRDEAYWRDLISKDRFCSEFQSFWIHIGNRVRHWHCIFFGDGSHEHLELVKFQQFMHFFYSLVNDGLFLNCGMFCSKLSTSWPWNHVHLLIVVGLIPHPYTKSWLESSTMQPGLCPSEKDLYAIC